MNNFFRRNQKKLLAVLGSFLMIVFILPTTCGQGGGTREDPVVAYAGDDEIFASEMSRARADWDLLQRIPAQAPRVAMQMGMSPFQQVPYPYQLGIGLAQEIQQRPELFLLLQKEAERNGIRIPPDRVNDALRQINLSPNVSAEEKERWQRAVEGFLRVKSLYDRVASNVKVSEPVVARQLATTSQEPQLNLVEFNADAAAGTATAPATGPASAPATAPTTAPSEQDLQAHFDRYKNRPAGLPSTNPAKLTFGYQRPDRVKLQYLSIREDQVREAVRKSKEPYDWEVAARRHYMANLPAFPVTQPASAPATTQSTQPTTAASRPTTRPFEEVRDQVMERVMEPEVEKLKKQVTDAIAKRMTADWEKQRPARPATTGPATASAQQPATNPAAANPAAATNPATQPAATQPGGFASFAYLENLAADIQKQFGVLPAVTSKSDQWLTADDLSALPGIGTARRQPSGASFANYVIQFAEPFMPVPQSADPAAVLSVLEPSQPVEDISGNVYLFRLTDAQPAHAPQSLAEVREQVEADYRAGQAYDRAVEAARQLAEAAKKQGLAQAAAAAGLKVITTGTIGRGMFGLPPTTIPSYPTTPESRQAIVTEAADLLAQATPDAPHPVGVVELPEDRKVVVAELGAVTSRLPADQAYLTRLGVAHQMEFQEAQNLAAEWFTEAAIKARLNYRSLDEEDSRPAGDAGAADRTASAS